MDCLCKPGRYTISAFLEGFETAVAKDYEWKDGAASRLELILIPAANKQSIEVVDTASPAEMSSEPSATVGGVVAKELPSRPSTVNDALPLIPGIARQPSGSCNSPGAVNIAAR